MFKMPISGRGVLVTLTQSRSGYAQKSTSFVLSYPNENWFTGHYYHAKSGLGLTKHRAYNPTLGRWLSRDPSGESGGLNLYGYVGNNPLNLTDSLGLCPGDWWDPRTWFNEGFTNSLFDTWTSLQDSSGDMLMAAYAGDWSRLPADTATSPLGQVENNPAAYKAEWALIIASGAADATAGGAWLAQGWDTLSPSAKFAVVNQIMRVLTGEGEDVKPPTRPPPQSRPPWSAGP